LVILLDGVNEHRSPQAFFESVGEFLGKCPPKSVKLVVSWRINSPRDFPEPFTETERFIYSTSAGYAAAEGTVLQRSAGKLKPLDKKEIAGTWTKYRSHRQKIFRPLFSIEDLELKDRSFAATLSNPLLLRTFLEIYNGKALRTKQETITIWSAWYENLKQRIPGCEDFLMAILEQMFRQGEAELDLDGLYDHPLLKEIMCQLDIDSPYRRLLALAVISQYFKRGFLVVSFTLDAVYHYLMSRYLTERLGIGTGEGFARILEEKGAMSGMQEAVGIALADDVVTGNGRILAEYVETKGAIPDAAALAMAKAVEMGNPETLVSDLASRNLETAAEILLRSDYILERNLLTDIRYRAFGTLAQIAEKAVIDPDLRFRIFWHQNIAAHERGRYEEALQYAQKMDELRTVSGMTDEILKGRVINRLAVAYRKLMRSVDAETATVHGEKAIGRAAAAMAIMERLLPNNHPEICQIYDNLQKVHEYRGEWKDAIAWGNKRIEALEASLDRWHPLLASAYNNTAIVLREDGQEGASIEFSRHAMEIVSRSLGPNHIEMAYANWTLANTCDKFGRPNEAAVKIRKTIAILKKLLPPDHPNIAKAEKTLAGFQRRT